MRKPENFVLSPEDVFRIVEPHSLIELLSEPSLLADRCSITSMMEGTALYSDSLDWSPEELVEIIIEKTEEGAYRTDITLADDEGVGLTGTTWVPKALRDYCALWVGDTPGVIMFSEPLSSADPDLGLFEDEFLVGERFRWAAARIPLTPWRGNSTNPTRIFPRLSIRPQGKLVHPLEWLEEAFKEARANAVEGETEDEEEWCH